MSISSEFYSSLQMETICHGDHNENDKRIKLRAGSLSMIYENGNLRYISDGKNELIRMIYSAVRDREWLTIFPEIKGEKIKINYDSFNIEYDCLYRSGKISFYARYKIEGRSDNTIIFSFEGTALDTFEKNRIGFCVLHPAIEYAGRACNIIHSNDKSEMSVFPRFISPYQPFMDITSMKWNIGNTEYMLVFVGDIFETEDQRNWTDASYKTYCTPLKLPFPVIVNKGDKINQRVEFRANTNTEYEKTENNNIGLAIYPEKTSSIPKIGIGLSSRMEPLSEREFKILKNIHFDHYRVDLYLFKEDWKIKADIAVNEALRLKYPVEMALFFDDDAIRQAAEFTQWLSEKNIEIAIISLFHKSHQVTPDRLTDSISPFLKNAFPGIIIACGTNANFAQLNRNRPGSVYADHICYSIHPQEHASDNTTLIENLQAQQYTVESTRNFSNGKGIWISPVNIQRRFNANIENYESPTNSDIFPPQVDSRQMSLFGACWTTGSLKYLMESGIKGVTYFETVGERGIFQGDFKTKWPERFQSDGGMLFPLFHIFRFVLKYKSYYVVKSKSTKPLIVDILTLSDGQHIKVIVSNFTSESQEVTFTAIKGDYTVRQLNNNSFAEASCDIDWIEKSSEATFNAEEKVHLAPFSVSFISGGSKI